MITNYNEKRPRPISNIQSRILVRFTRHNASKKHPQTLTTGKKSKFKLESVNLILQLISL